MATFMDPLRALRDALAALPGVSSSRIGVEATISPDDYPAVRLVPAGIAVPGYAASLPNGSVREHTVRVHFGVPQHEFEDGLEGLYDALAQLERKLIDGLPITGPYPARYVRTFQDDGLDEAYMMLTMEVVVSGQA